MWAQTLVEAKVPLSLDHYFGDLRGVSLKKSV